jgi:hypothetical protein
VLPHDALDQDPDQLAAVLQQAAAWLAALPVERARELLEARAGKAVPAESLRLLAQAEAVASCAPDFRVRPRRGLRWTIQTMGDQVALQLPDCRLELPGYTADALRRALTTVGTPAELGAAGLGLDTDDAVVLVRRLLREGAVVGAG